MSKFNKAAYQEKVLERRKEESEWVELPSGMEFLLCKVDMSVFLQGGKLPSSYVEIMLGMQGKDAKQVQEIVANLTPEEEAADHRFMGMVVHAACTEPQIVDEPVKDSEIVFEALDAADRKFIYRWAITPKGADAVAAESFRKTAKASK